ncbi:MAG TPA: aldose 1-epimerase [Bryobacteraceae bacterium]|nr:aldose 1-epimerase [Bryobacteraceae bacterium]
MKPVDCREHRIGAQRAITISNGLLTATVLPEKGADIYSLVFEPRRCDVLWKSPWGLRRPSGATASGAASEAAWLDQYEGGWQEIFPNGGDACTYRGAPLNFHGEASVSAWDYSIRQTTPGALEIEFQLALARSPFHIRRTMRLEAGQAALRFDESIENRGEEDLHFMWGHHPALGAPFLDGGCRIQTPASTFLAHDVEIAETCRIAAGTRGNWPRMPGKGGREVDLSLVPLAQERVTEFGYLCDLSDGWYAVTNPALEFGFGLAWPKQVFPYLWFWQELRGSFGYPWYGRCYVMAIEPFTSLPGVGLSKAIENGTAPVLKAGGRVEASLAAVFLEDREVESISVDGGVRYRGSPPGRERS